MPRPIEWKDNRLVLLDQTKLPCEETYLTLDDHHEIARAISTLAVRGAPAIGVAAAYGLALAALNSHAETDAAFRRDIEEAASELGATRPTAVNLFSALDRVTAAIMAADGLVEARDAALQTAQCLFNETEVSDRALARYGDELIDDGDCMLTICNTGALATGAFGTALGVIRAAWDQGKDISVLACETRPLLQGARLTMWELDRYGIPAAQIVDGAAAHFMRHGRVQKVITGADRIAANGDTANKIGTYGLACLAERHHLPFYIAAPLSTVDLDTAGAGQIAIEERSPSEVKSCGGTMISPADASARNPAFDVTPADLITAIITDAGVLRPPYAGSLRGAVEAGKVE